ncbi:MAG: substrate-binding domain-containing protein, partial [Clostridia bacterium]
ALVTTVSENDNSYLKRVIATQLVDGVILTRSMTNDETLLYLRNNQIPFVIIGSQEDKTIPQVDGNHIKASRELTKTLLDKSASVAILLGGTNYMVNENRYKGYAEAYKDKGITLDSNIVYTNLIAPEQIEKAIDNLYTYNVKTVICGDDNLCMQALNHLAKRGISIPWQIKVASLYDSPLLSNRTPPITAVEIDDRKLGALAAETLINLIEGNETSESNKTPDYQIHYRLSTELI